MGLSPDQLELVVGRASRVWDEVKEALDDDSFIIEHVRVSPVEEDGTYHVCQIADPGEIETCCWGESVPPKEMEVHSAELVLSDEAACDACQAFLTIALYGRGYNEL